MAGGEGLALQALPDNVYALDSAYVRPGLDAIHLIAHRGRAALVESGTQHSVPLVMAALEQIGLAPEAVDWLLLTHIHLDHAAGAGALLQALPNARLVVHPRGVRHMVDPSRLWAATVAVYGEDFARREYGELLPVEPARIVEARDGLVIDLAGRAIEVADTPGHARHHVCYWDGLSRGWFSGDAFGLSYRETHVGKRAFVLPATTPSQFEPQIMQQSIDRLLARQPACMYLTHYSRVEDVARLGADLHRLIDAYVVLAQDVLDEKDPVRQYAALHAKLVELVHAESARQGWAVQGEAAVALYAVDLALNAQGLQGWMNQL